MINFTEHPFCLVPNIWGKPSSNAPKSISFDPVYWDTSRAQLNCKTDCNETTDTVSFKHIRNTGENDNPPTSRWVARCGKVLGSKWAKRAFQTTPKESSLSLVEFCVTFEWSPILDQSSVCLAAYSIILRIMKSTFHHLVCRPKFSLPFNSYIGLQIASLHRTVVPASFIPGEHG